nr:hypothetical protein FRC0402_01704 [Corynebacterium diphtheriae]
MPRSTERYGLPYPLESDTIRSLPGMLQQLSTRIAAVLGEIEEKAQKAASNTNEARRSAKAAEEAAASVPKLPDGLDEMLKAWRQLGSDKDTVLRPLMDRISKLENGGSAPKLKLKDTQVAVDFTNDVPVIVAGNPSLIDLIKKKTIRLVSGTYTANHQVMTARYEIKEIGDSLAATSYMWTGQDDQMVITFTKTS